TLGQGWTHASGRRCTPGLIHRMTQGSTLASMSHPAPSGVDITLSSRRRNAQAAWINVFHF
ncbi:MAG: hypothetical protein ACOZCP_20645, partial [Pseudomonadota bacterium]